MDCDGQVAPLQLVPHSESPSREQRNQHPRMEHAAWDFGAANRMERIRFVRPDGAAIEIVRAVRSSDSEGKIPQLEQYVQALGQTLSSLYEFNVQVDEYLGSLEGRIKTIVHEGDRLGLFAMETNNKVEKAMDHSVSVLCKLENVSREVNALRDHSKQVARDILSLHATIKNAHEKLDSHEQMLVDIPNTIQSEFQKCLRRQKILPTLENLQSSVGELSDRLTLQERRLPAIQQEVDALANLLQNEKHRSTQEITKLHSVLKDLQHEHTRLQGEIRRLGSEGPIGSPMPDLSRLVSECVQREMEEFRRQRFLHEDSLMKRVNSLEDEMRQIGCGSSPRLDESSLASIEDRVSVLEQKFELAVGERKFSLQTDLQSVETRLTRVLDQANEHEELKCRLGCLENELRCGVSPHPTFDSTLILRRLGDLEKNVSDLVTRKQLCGELDLLNDKLQLIQGIQHPVSDSGEGVLDPMGSFELAIQALKGEFLRLERAFKTLSLRVTQHGEAMRDEFSRFAPSNEVVRLDNKLERAIQTFRDQLKSIDSSFKVKVEKGSIDGVSSDSHVTMTVLRDCIDKAVAPLQEAMAEVMAVLADTKETESAAHNDEGVHGLSLIEDEDAHKGRTGDTSLYPGGAFSKRVPVHFHDSDESIFAKGDKLLKGGPIKKLVGMAMTSLQQRAKWEEDETPLDPPGEHTDSSSTELHAFFKSLEDEVSLKSAQTGAGKGRVHRIRGLLSGELDEQELKLMDDTTKKDIKRFITRPHWDGSWKTLHIYMRKWKFYMSYWGRFLSPVLKALTFISSLPDEYAELYLELMHELNWTYQDMYFELLDEARECADESFVEDEWEELTPSSGDYRSYRKWYLQWRVLLARVGECTASHAKKVYMRALTRCGFFDELLEEMVEAEIEALKEFTFEECNRWLIPKLLTQYKAQAVRGRYHKREVRGVGGAPRGGSAPPSSIVCPRCKGPHTLDKCWAEHPSLWPKWLKDGAKKANLKVSQIQGRLKAGKCPWCGGDKHTDGKRCPKRPSQKSDTGMRRPKPRAQADPNSDRRKRKCEHCGKSGHFKDKCWELHPELKPAANPQGTGKGKGKDE